MSSKIIQIERLTFPWQTLDPFVFCAYHRDLYPEGNEHMGPKASLAGRNIGQDFTIRDGWRMYHGETVPGFPYHPHRGFETITIAKEGFVDHTDSLGAAGRFGAGDVQWMTAGKGVQHSEMFPLVHADKSNTLEIFQIWLNLPQKSKMVEPHFKMLWKKDIPKVQIDGLHERKVVVDVIAGHLGAHQAPDPTPDSWAADPDNYVQVLTIQMDPGSIWEIEPTVEGINRSIYLYEGESVKIDDVVVQNEHAIHLSPTESVTLEAGRQEVKLLFLQGRPINEPVVQYGPFVMNTEEEIREAFQEFRQTQFGGWPWPNREQTHPREKGRFALHADGREEVMTD